MAYHDWSDEDFDWKGLNEAQDFIRKYVKTWSRCNVITKEKYGTIRYEWLFPPGGSVRYGFHIKLPYFTRSNKYMDNIPIVLWRWQDSIIYRLWFKLGVYTLNKAVHKAVKKWPHLKDEILEDYYFEYLT